MRSTPQGQVERAVFAAFSPRLQVSELESARLVAAMAVFADEGAAGLVPRPHFSAKRCRNRTFPGTTSGLAGPRFVGDAGLPFEYLSQQRVERLLDDGSGVAV